MPDKAPGVLQSCIVLAALSGHRIDSMKIRIFIYGKAFHPPLPLKYGTDESLHYHQPGRITFSSLYARIDRAFDFHFKHQAYIVSKVVAILIKCKHSIVVPRPDRSLCNHDHHKIESVNLSSMYANPAQRFFAWFSLSTFFTIFCSSIKNALTTRSFTQFAHLEPP